MDPWAPSAIACRVGFFVAAVLAEVLARPRLHPWHRRVAHGIAGLFLADLVRWVLWGPLDRAPTPYVGLFRVFFHLDWALVLLFPAVVVGLALVTLTPWRKSWRLAALAWGACVLVQTLGYPQLRRAPLELSYTVVHGTAVAVEIAVAVRALVKGIGWGGPTKAAVLILIVGDWAALFGPFLRGHPIADWLPVRWQAAAVWAILAAWHGRVLWSISVRMRRASRSRSGASSS